MEIDVRPLTLQRTSHGIIVHPEVGPLIFGGFDEHGRTYNLLQAWTGDGWSIVDSANPPPHRAFPAIAYDAARDAIVLVGGLTWQVHPLGDAWEWKDRQWRPIEGPVPSARLGHAVAYDPRRERVVLFGGLTHEQASDETWEWDGAAWARCDVQIAPPPRGHHSMAYDADSGAVLVFGGFDPRVGVYGDTWLWDGRRWTHAETGPPPRFGASLSPMRRGGGLWLVGGSVSDIELLADVWCWRHGQWHEAGTLGPTLARYWHAAAEAEDSDSLLVFGGSVKDGVAGDVLEITLS